MDYFRRFTFLFAAPVFDNDDLEGLRFNQIITEIERSGFEVVRARRLEDAEIAVQTDGCVHTLFSGNHTIFDRHIILAVAGSCGWRFFVLAGWNKVNVNLILIN